MKHWMILPLVSAWSWGQATPANPAPPQAAPSKNTAQPVQNTAQPAQNAAQTAEMTSRDAPLTFSSRVNLVQVPVVVRDQKGRAVGNLEKSDFQLFDKGKPQVITRFSVEKPGTPSIPAVTATDENAGKPGDSPEIVRRFVAYIFDDVHLAFQDMSQAREAADKYLADNLEPGSRAAIYTTSGVNQLDFTGDHDAMYRTLMNMLPRPISGTIDPEPDCPQSNQRSSGSTANATSAAAAAAIATCAASSNLDLAQRQQETQLTLSVLDKVIRRISVSPGSRNIIVVSPGFLIYDDLQRRDEIDLMDRAVRSTVTISTLDARGLYTIVPGGDASHTGSTNQAQIAFDSDNARAQSDVLAELAYSTGGTFFQNNNSLAEGFKGAAAQPEFMYVLGFAPQNLKLDGQFHALKVTLKEPKGYDLQARRGYYAPRHVTDPAEEAKQEIQEAVFSRDELQEIPVDLHLQFFKSSDAAARISVLAQVDLKHLHFKKVEDRNDDTLTIVSTLFDRNGNFITGIQKTLDMRLLDQTFEKLPAGGITIKTTLDVIPGSYVVRLVVRDSEGQMMAARNGVVEIP